MANINLSNTGTNTTALAVDINANTSNNEMILFNDSASTIVAHVTGESTDVTYDTEHTFHGLDLTEPSYVVSGGTGVNTITFKLPAKASVQFRASNSNSTNPQAVTCAVGDITTTHQTPSVEHQLVSLAVVVAA